MQKARSVLLMLMILLLFASAQATDIEVIGPNVNFRDAPHGKVIARLSGGEVLSAADEAWANDTLWYQVHSDQYGDGFVSGEWARPVYNGITIYDPENPDKLQYVTENVESFYLALFRFLYANGYCYWDPAEGGCTFRVSKGKGDESIVRPMHKVDLAIMLLTNGLLVETQETDVLQSEAASDEEKLTAANSILRKHYGTEDMWQILVFGGIYGGVVGRAETHAAHGMIENSDAQRLIAIQRQVDREYMGAE